MTGTLKAAIYIVLATFISILLLASSGREASAVNYGVLWTAPLTDSTPHANSNVDAAFNATLAAGFSNWIVLRTVTSSTAFVPSTDGQIPNGAGNGQVDYLVQLGLINGPCNTPTGGSIPMLDSTTDIYHTADFEGTGANLVMDDDADGVGAEAEDTNDVPTYSDHYPSFLNTLFDPDGFGTNPPIRPRARYMGHQEVVDGVPPTMLQLIVFNPGDLGDSAKGLPQPDAAIDDEFGYPSFVIVNNPTGAAAPTAITDWCATNSTTRLKGTTQGQWSVIDGPEPIEFDRAGACVDVGAPGIGPEDDSDGDGVPNDGCLSLNAGVNAGIVRTENPGPLTGIYETGTHLARSYSQSYRDADGDNLANDLDVCTVVADAGTDVDADGIDGACDLNNALGSSPATEVDNGIDEDGDTSTDEDPFDNKDNDNDGWVDEDGGCTGVQGLPDADQDCYPNRGDNCPQTPNDGRDLDLTTRSGPAADNGMLWDNIGDSCDAAGAVAEVTCTEASPATNAADNDTDGIINDGCPIFPTPPNAFYDKQNAEDPILGGKQLGLGLNGDSCADGVDNDGGGGPDIDAADPDCYDGQEWGAQCQNNLDDDADTRVNDGCPSVGGGTAAGDYNTILRTAYVCIPDPDGSDDTDPGGDSDDDDDGVCDSTEMLLGSDPNNVNSTPEYIGIEYDGLRADNNGDTVPDAAHGVCNDRVSEPAGAVIDNDLDGDANGVDTDGNTVIEDDCASTPVLGVGADTDKDGVADSYPDNCMTVDNPGQQNTDGDASGDDCDTDDDGDGHLDTRESYMGTDPKDDCSDDNTAGRFDDAYPSDANRDTAVLGNDIVILFLGKVFTSVGQAAYSPRSDLNADGSILGNDIVIGFLGKVFTNCAKSFVFTVPAATTINDIHLQFTSRVVIYVDSPKITDSGCTAGAWPNGTIGAGANGTKVDSTKGAAGTCNDGDTVTVKINAKRTPVLKCWDWTMNSVVVPGSPIPCP